MYATAITGTSFPATLAMRLMPPRMTAPASTMITRPVTQCGRPIDSPSHRPRSWTVRCYRCRRRPPHRTGRRARRARPTSCRVRCGYSTSGHRHAPRLVDLAIAHRQDCLGELGRHADQGRDPHPEDRTGPPRKMAVATPAMLPVPMVADSDVISALKGDTSPSSSSPAAVRRPPHNSRKPMPNLRMGSSLRPSCR